MLNANNLDNQEDSHDWLDKIFSKNLLMDTKWLGKR